LANAHPPAQSKLPSRSPGALAAALVLVLAAARPSLADDPSPPPAIHFENDIVPILSKLGCNSGGCHGKASGQNGFRLSVFGFDPAADYDAIVKEARGRRVFPASPERSLFLLKPTAQVPHGGGKRMDVDSRDFAMLLDWLAQGMPIGSDSAPKLVGLELTPTERVMQLDAEQQIVATAKYSNGSTRDVTDAAAYTSSAESIAEVNQRGLARTGLVPGEAAITANYMGQIAAVQIQVPRPGAPNPYPKLPSNNRVDELVWAKLEKMGIVPSDLADNTTFLRRLFIDTIGTLPTPDEVRAFLADTSADKRARAIESVVARDEYADYWAIKWADILLVDRNKLGERGAFEFHRWLREQFARNRPYDEWVRELVTATGDSATNGPANFYRAVRSPEEATKSVSQAFLGVRLECAQCHHHPFDKWGQADFYGLAGFFNGVERKTSGVRRDPAGQEFVISELIYHAGPRETRIPYFNTLVTTRVLDGGVARPESSKGVAHAGQSHFTPSEDSERATRGDPRIALADWMTGPENSWFARLIANRLWKQFLGRGLVEPEDDLRSTSPATNEPLLSYLAEQVVASDYNLKAVMRLILNSRVYQLSSVPNETNRDDTQNFSHYYVKRLPAEVLLDAISDATGSPEQFPGKPPGTRAIALWDNRLPSYFLEIFGRPERSSPCECGRSSEPTMAQALHLMNAPEVTEKITSPTGRVSRLIHGQAPDRMIVEELCLAALGRLPTEKESKVAQRFFARGPRQQAAEDFLWTLLNAYDFVFVR
jgi:hypothetical protein